MKSRVPQSPLAVLPCLSLSILACTLGTAPAATATAMPQPSATLQPTDTPVPSETPEPTQTPRPTPTSTPSPTPTPDWPFTLSYDFSASSHDWLTGEASDEFGTSNLKIEDGRYRWELSATQNMYLNVWPERTAVSGFVLTVEADQVSGTEGNGYGVIFRRAGDESGYMFEITDDGWFTVWRLDSPEWTPLIDWDTTSTIHPDRLNRLTVIAEGTHFVFYINDELVGQAADGVLTSTDGAYYPLGDFDESLAQLNYYEPFEAGRAPSDFVIRADAAWESASRTADWWASGCGFVFRRQDPDNEYLVFLGLDGTVYLQRTERGAGTLLGSSYYGRLDVPAGEAQLMLVAQGDQINFFVNDELVHSRRDSSLDSGALAYTHVSGTNKDFGTRCQMTNVELWELE